MTRKPRQQTDPFRDDPTVAEVRRWRTRLEKSSGGTVKGLMHLLDSRAATRPAATKAGRQRSKAKRAA